MMHSENSTDTSGSEIQARLVSAAARNWLTQNLGEGLTLATIAAPDQRPIYVLMSATATHKGNTVINLGRAVRLTTESGSLEELAVKLWKSLKETTPHGNGPSKN